LKIFLFDYSLLLRYEYFALHVIKQASLKQNDQFKFQAFLKSSLQMFLFVERFLLDNTTSLLYLSSFAKTLLSIGFGEYLSFLDRGQKHPNLTNLQSIECDVIDYNTLSFYK